MVGKGGISKVLGWVWAEFRGSGEDLHAWHQTRVKSIFEFRSWIFEGEEWGNGNFAGLGRCREGWVEFVLDRVEGVFYNSKGDFRYKVC